MENVLFLEIEIAVFFLFSPICPNKVPLLKDLYTYR